MSPLHHIGEFFRELLLQVPLGVVRMLFVLVPSLLLIWVLRLPKEETTPPNQPESLGGNLKLWAAVALALQVLVYAFF